MTPREMTQTAPVSYWRRHQRRVTIRRCVMAGAFAGMACGFIALVLQ